VSLSCFLWVLENLAVAQLVMTFPALCGVQSTLSHPAPSRYILILSSHLRLSPPGDLFPSGFATKIYTFLISPIHATHIAHLFSLISSRSHEWCLVKNTNYEAPNYAVFSASYQVTFCLMTRLCNTKIELKKHCSYNCLGLHTRLHNVIVIINIKTLKS
jgi:hypothetical protein